VISPSTDRFLTGIRWSLITRFHWLLHPPGVADKPSHQLATAATTTRLGSDIFFYGLMIYMISRQVKRRPVRRLAWYMPALYLALSLGLLYFTYEIYRHPISIHAALLLTASFTILGIGMGVLRARTIQFWREGAVIYRRGTIVTVALWAVAVGLHITVDYLSHVGSASLLLYLAITFITQALVVRHRVRTTIPLEDDSPGDEVMTTPGR
jgi:hypothetical protein